MVLIALSELSGYLTIAYLSQVDSFFTDDFSAMGLREIVRVLGSLKVALFQIFVFWAVWAPFFTAEAACFALYTKLKRNGESHGPR
jgi:hypothetical protein